MKKFMIITILITTILLNFSIESPNKKDNNNSSKPYIVYNLEKEPKDLTMTDNYNVREKDLLLALFEGLVEEDKEGKIVPALCESYEISKDRVEYKFKLKENALFSNGRNIISKDIANFFSEFLSDEENIYRKELYCIFGAESFAKGETDFSSVAINIIDDKNFAIRLNSPCDELLEFLCSPVMTIRQYNEVKENYKENYEYNMYTGPFIIENINKNGEILISKNNNYYNKNITNEKILYTFIEDKEMALAEFEDSSSNIDILVNPPINEHLRLYESGNTEGFLSNNSVYINFNLNKESSFNDLNMRKAVAYSISKEYFAQQISKDSAVAARAYTLDSNNIFEPYGNKTLAEKFLKESNYSDENTLIFLYEDNNIERRIAEDLCKDINEDLNLNIKLVRYKKEDLKEILESKDYDMILNIYYDLQNDYNYLQLWNSHNNPYGFSNENYDNNLNAIKNEKNEQKIIELQNNCEKILMENLPSMPIYNLNTVLCRKENIKGLYANKYGNVILNDVYVDKTKSK